LGVPAACRIGRGRDVRAGASLRAMKCARVVTIMVALAAIAGAAASAAPATIYNPGHFYRNATGTFTGAERTNHTFVLTRPSGGAAVLLCTSAAYAGTKPLFNGFVTSLAFTPSFSGCSLFLSPTWYPATQTSGCAWLLNAGSYDGALGSMTGSFTDCTTMTFSVPALSCTITLATYQSIGSNPDTQDRDAFDIGDTGHAFAGAMRVVFDDAQLESTNTCTGWLQTPSTGGYTGTEFLPGVWIGP
jgi:hypothetical protein